MISKFISSAKSLSSLSKRKKITVVATLVLVITLPTLVAVLSKEQNYSSKADVTTVIEAESGTLSGNVVVKSNADASGGKYILFGGSNSQSPTPTPYKVTPIPTSRPSVNPTAKPTIKPMPTPTPLLHGNSHGNGNGNHQ